MKALYLLNRLGDKMMGVQCLTYNSIPVDDLKSDL